MSYNTRAASPRLKIFLKVSHPPYFVIEWNHISQVIDIVEEVNIKERESRIID